MSLASVVLWVMVKVLFADMQFFPDDGYAIVCFVSKIKLPSGHMVHPFHVNGRTSAQKLHMCCKKLHISTTKNCTSAWCPEDPIQSWCLFLLFGNQCRPIMTLSVMQSTSYLDKNVVKNVVKNPHFPPKCSPGLRREGWFCYFRFYDLKAIPFPPQNWYFSWWILSLRRLRFFTGRLPSRFVSGPEITTCRTCRILNSHHGTNNRWVAPGK